MRAIGVLLLALVAACRPAPLPPGPPPPATVEDRLAQYGAGARARLRPHFDAAGVPYPPARVVLVGLKRERELQVYAAAADGEPRWVRSHPVLAASGGPGPKLVQGDGQVPEGLYGIESLNPNSRYHLSLRVGYPNGHDVARAAADGRTNLGGDIMIHGGAGSTGCLAVGDEAAEDLFVLAADAGPGNVAVILAPVDFRLRTPPPPQAAWIRALYRDIRRALAALPPPTKVDPRRSFGSAL